MCGFTVFYNLKNLNNKKNINKLFDFIKTRGPDKNKIIKHKNITFLFSRLSIQDLSKNGDQPIFSSNRKFIMVFNGEIYNHLDLRKKISFLYPQKKWKGKSDSETLIESFEIFGVSKTLSLISGMYSIFLFNIKKNEFFIINDIFGEKPLYYEINNDNFLVSSSMNSFLLEKKKIDLNYSSNLLIKNYIPHPHTAIKGVKKINPTSYIKFKISNNKIIKIFDKKYYFLKNIKKEFYNESFESLSQLLEKYLLEAVEEQLISDVPLGTFLSGGIDSTLVTALASKVSKKEISTFTIGFNNKKFNEAIYAKKISEYLKTNHNQKYFNSNHLFELFDNVISAYNEPFSDSSQLPTMLLCKFASSKVKVCLTGDGGDELFGGYNRYVFNPKLWNILKFIPSEIRSLLSPISSNQFFIALVKIILGIYDKRFRNMHYIEQKINSIFTNMNSKSLGELTFKLSSHLNFQDLDKFFYSKLNFKKVFPIANSTKDLMLNDLKNYLPGDLLVKVDRASMNYGLETRMPFLNKKVYEFSNRIPMKFKIDDKFSKIILKDILYRYVPKKLIERPKQGFLIPINEIMKSKDIIHKIDKILDKDKIANQKVFKEQQITKLWESFKSGYKYDQYLIWDIIIFQSWIDKNESSLLLS